MASWTLFQVASLLLILSTAQPSSSQNVLPFLPLNSSSDVETQAVGHFGNGASEAIHIPGGFPFEGVLHDTVFIGTNGILSFGQPLFTSAPTTPFPTTRNDIRNLFLVAPFWDNVDIVDTGNIFYEVHDTFSDSPDSQELLTLVSEYIEAETGEIFFGEWMLLVQWDQVHPFPHSLQDIINPFLLFLLFPDIFRMNTWQAILITDGSSSYTVFTYRCGLMGWSRSSTHIGFNAAGRIFENHPLSGVDARALSCANFAEGSVWSNVLYNLTTDNINITEPSPYEPPQAAYLQPLSFLGVNSSGTLENCRNCTSGPINLGTPGIPFGYYYHERAYVGVNGIISFDNEFGINFPENFPTSEGAVHFAYLVAPYWSDVDTRRAGSVRYETYTRGDSEASDRQIHMVEDFLAVEQNVTFSGEWMMLVSWESVPPFPHGDAADLPRENPYLELTNTFQTVIISDYNKTYAIFTYECDSMEWSDGATIGFNAAADFYSNHPLSGSLRANIIGCVHTDSDTEPIVRINNVVYDLVPSTLNMSTPPTTFRTVGRCVAANYSECCADGDCFGSAEDCVCDSFCHVVGDCCSDINSTCPLGPPPNNDSYLVFANGAFINRVDPSGDLLHTLANYPEQTILTIDYDYRRGFLYWSDLRSDQLFRSNLDGTDMTFLAMATNENIEGIAVDWIGNNLYWTETVTKNIEVLDLDTFERVILLNIGENAAPRGIAVDPATREVFWTDWGDESKIEKASMDGSDRQVLHSTALVWPNDISLDYATTRLYWVDASTDRIEFSFYNGSGRTALISNLDHPFSLTITDNLIFWSDWSDNTLRVAHRFIDPVEGVLDVFLRQRPHGMKYVSPDAQALVPNPCADNTCSHICLLSSTESSGFKCLCPRGFELLPNGTECENVTTSPPSDIGSCSLAGFSICCVTNPFVIDPTLCQGSEPGNCFCDSQCRSRGDCCPDIDTTCPNDGSCSDAGFQGCCNPRYTDTCVGSDGRCFCDRTCFAAGDCCGDANQICSFLIGTCADAGITECCESGDCLGSESNCKCDAGCRERADCCIDIDDICVLNNSTEVTTEPLTTTFPEETTTQDLPTTETPPTTTSSETKPTSATAPTPIILDKPTPGGQGGSSSGVVAGSVIGLLILLAIIVVIVIVLVIYGIRKSKSSSYLIFDDQKTENGTKTPINSNQSDVKPSSKGPVKEFDNPVYDDTQGEFEKDDLALI